nr:ribosomal protein S4 [Guinardia striata]
MIIKKSKYKPLFKKFIRLRKNVQNRKKLLTGFKKKKWLNLVTFLKVSSQRRKKNFKNFDQYSFFVSKFGNSYKKKYLNNLLLKQRISLFYGQLADKKLKQVIKQAKFRLNKSQIPVTQILIDLLECRLDTVLYRANFSKSIRESRLLIQHRHIYVNNSLMTNNSYIVQPGDIISVSNICIKNIKFNVFNSNLWPITPSNFMVNYKTFQIIFLNNTNLFELAIYFPFWLDLNTLITYRKY